RPAGGLRRPGKSGRERPGAGFDPASKPPPRNRWPRGHPSGVLEGLQRLRANPKLADVTLVAGGREFPCHRGVLALCSHYFHAMFSGDFAESTAARVELKEVDPSALEMLLDFAYTGKVTINQGNVEELMRTASQLHFPTIQKVCSRYLRQQMDATNCLGICEFGESHGCPEVSSKAWSFLQENFEGHGVGGGGGGKSEAGLAGGSLFGSTGFQGNGWLCLTSPITTNGAFPWCL
uniref:Kelch like family member 30 n=1 Tax=Athene cunicularia TaxID=194338 RepID=A0A663LMK0_ATHCN